MRRTFEVRARIVVAFTTVGLVAACGSAAAPAGIDPDDAKQVKRGEAVYAQFCAACHGARLEGQPEWRSRLPSGRLPAPPHDESGHTWHHDDALLVNITRDGMVPPWAPEGYESDMPAFRGVLPDEDIHAVLAYIQSTWSDEVRKIRRERLAAMPR